MFVEATGVCGGISYIAIELLQKHSRNWWKKWTCFNQVIGSDRKKVWLWCYRMKLALNQWIIYKPFTSKCSVGKLFAVVLKIFAHFFAFFMRTLQIMIGIHFRKSTYPHFLLLVNVFVLCRSESDKRPIISEMNDWNEKFHGWDGTEPNQPKKNVRHC